MAPVADESVRAQMIALLPRLRRFARSLAGTADQADDLVQAACERALARIDQWTPGTRLDSWMFRIVQTIWLDDRRATRVRLGEGHVTAEAAEPELVVDGAGRMESRMTLAAVRRAMGRLPEEQRAVLTLVCVEGLTYREASDALGVPIGTVMSRLARARSALVRDLGEGQAGTTGNVVRLGEG